MSLKPPLRILVLILPLLAGACTRPPAGSFAVETGDLNSGEPAGADAKGGDCFARSAATVPAELPILRTREVFCGGWSQPAARVVQLRGAVDAAQLEALATGGVWRSWLEQRVSCGAPQVATLAGGIPARVLTCIRRAGGWPHVALVAAGPEGPVVADGVATAVPVMERLASGEAASAGGAQARSAALEATVRRLSADSFSVKDVGRYEQLMSAGRDLNQAESFATAEDAYRQALALQERVLGRDDPNSTTALIHLALNLSNQGRNQEAGALFTRAAALTPRAADPAGAARLAHYRGLHALNEGKVEAALQLLRQAETDYRALVPPDALRGEQVELGTVTDPVSQSAVLGLAEAQRNLAIALGRTGKAGESLALVVDSRALLRRTGLEPGLLVARSLRTEAGAHAGLGRDETAARQLEASARRFAIAAPGERPEAVTLFLSGTQRAAAGRQTEALRAFRAGSDILRARQIALPVGLIISYLDTLDAEAKARPAEAESLRREMFSAAQLAQRSNTVRFVQQASARIGAAAGNQKAGEAVRRLQEADEALRALFVVRDAAPTTGIDQQIAATQKQRAEAEEEVAAAAPGYRQLLLSATTVDAVSAVLGPREALVSMLLGRDHGYVMAVRGGQVSVARTALSEVAAGRQVAALRAGVVDANGQPGRYDPAPAQTLYQTLIAPLAAALDGAETLVIAPDGPLLALPFGMLLSGPAEPTALASAPWLIRRFAIVHVPSPQTFVTLRGAGTASTAQYDYSGFGDLVPPSGAQLLRSFPTDRCATDARLAAGLTRLPGTRVEVEEAHRLMKAGPRDIRLGSAFTAAAMREADLGQRKVIHLATHALLPGELSCLQEPSIVVSPPPGAPTADSAFVKASDLLGLKLDADLVILSACNTGGAGAGGGEALSGLARAFFFAGARGLMVTHWAVDDLAASLTVADALRRQQAGASSAAALRGAQLLLLDEAGKRLPASFGHPFYWAPFALIGDGRRPPIVAAAAGPTALQR